jgi:hypothetical protein
MKRICWYPRVKGWRKPPGAVWVGRPSRWGNPFDWREHGRAGAVEMFERHLASQPELVEAARRELSGKDLACRCPLDEPCHANVWLKVLAPR